MTLNSGNGGVAAECGGVLEVKKPASFFDSLASFQTLVGGQVGATAQGKGYAKAGDGRDLMDFVEGHCPGHGTGEIIYKVVRWQARHNPEDLVKIAAWAFLEWDRANRI